MPTCISEHTQLPPRSTLFPYTTLFRSASCRHECATVVSNAMSVMGLASSTRCCRPCSISVRSCCSAALKSVSPGRNIRSEEHTSELQSLRHLVCRLLLEKEHQ